MADRHRHTDAALQRQKRPGVKCTSSPKDLLHKPPKNFLHSARSLHLHSAFPPFCDRNLKSSPHQAAWPKTHLRQEGSGIGTTNFLILFTLFAFLQSFYGGLAQVGGSVLEDTSLERGVLGSRRNVEVRVGALDVLGLGHCRSTGLEGNAEDGWKEEMKRGWKEMGRGLGCKRSNPKLRGVASVASAGQYRRIPVSVAFLCFSFLRRSHHVLFILHQIG